MRKNLFIPLLSVFVIQLSFGQYEKEENLSNLMPWPKAITMGNSKFLIQKSFEVSVENDSNKRIYKATTRFIQRLSEETGVFFEAGFPIKTSSANPSLSITYDREGELKLNEDESYSLHVTNKKIELSAVTDIGILRGLETLLQLVNYSSDTFYVPAVTITDSPRFPWRGLMIDVARHFQPLDVLKRNLDAMAAVKLNVFHWHLTDDQGFRVASKTYPKLHELGSDGLYYTHEQIKEVVQYASDRGIRVLPEFDVPGHATAILTAYPEIGSKDTTYQIERNAGIFDPTLDPTNEKTYEMLSSVFEEMAGLFPDEYFHIGGDENEGKHWDENVKIRNFKKKNDIKSNHELQTLFNIRLQKILNKLDKKMIGWEEIMSPEIEKTAILHSWRGENEGLPDGQSLINAVQLGYHTILSNGYYIDRMHPVEAHYLVDPIPGNSKLTQEQKKMILGGEVTMWSELVTPVTIDSRIWPRTAAIAERFWSPKGVTDIEGMIKRLKNVSLQLEKLGITHIRNRDMILRNITKTNDIVALLELSKVCEPLKKYTRNKGGVEYQTYSPFALFADACTSDAEDAKEFNKLVSTFINQPNNKKVKSKLNQYLQKWSLLSGNLDHLDNPIINEIKPIANNLSKMADILSHYVKNNKITSSQEEILNTYLKKSKNPIVDVELMVIDSFEKLIEHLKTKKVVINK